MLDPWINHAGYPFVTLHAEGGATSKGVHQLVCAAFHGPCPPSHEVAHGDGNPLNPRWDNLRWATHADNNADKKLHGTHLVGSQTCNAKLTEDIVLELMRLAESGVSDEEIAAKFDVLPTTIMSIRLGHTWNWFTQNRSKPRASRKGEKHRRPSLTDEQILEIRELASTLKHTVIAAEYGISLTTVSHIKTRRIWKNI
jgi:hypothetical protein